MAVSIDDLYKCCDIIDGRIGEPKDDYSEDYIKILSGAKGGAGEKQLAAQFIVRYFHKFTDLQETAIDAIFELCEDDDVNTRKAVIRELPHLFKQEGAHIPKITDVLVQLLQAQDPQENHIVQNSLSTVLRSHTKVLKTLFLHISNAEEDLLRERALKFLALKIRGLKDTAELDKDLETYIIDECKKVLQDVTGDEFIILMNLLSQMSHLQTVAGRQELLQLVIEQADLDKEFDAADADRVDQVIQCTKQAIPYLSRNVHSTPFLQFILGKVFPGMAAVAKSAGPGSRLNLMRLTAELAPYAGSTIENLDANLDTVFKELLTYMPLPPSEDESAPASESTVNGTDPEAEPKLDFSELECTMWALHQLARKKPEFFTDESRAEVMRDFKKRLQYLARVIQVYSKKLRSILQDKSKEELRNEENKLKVMALRTTSNISTIVKDFLHIPPSLKSSISPSWKPLEPKASPGAKRDSTESTKTAIEAPPHKRSTRPEAARYSAPGGKWSEKVGRFPGWEAESSNGYEPGYNRRGRGRGGRGRQRYY